MTLTKKNFKAIAEMFNRFLNKHHSSYELINDFCLYLKSENPKFNENKFREAIKGYDN